LFCFPSGYTLFKIDTFFSLFDTPTRSCEFLVGDLVMFKVVVNTSVFLPASATAAVDPVNDDLMILVEDIERFKADGNPNSPPRDPMVTPDNPPSLWAPAERGEPQGVWDLAPFGRLRAGIKRPRTCCLGVSEPCGVHAFE
jgi:hypothetical protein